MRLKIVVIVIAFSIAGCSGAKDSHKEVPAFLLRFPAKTFAHPVGEPDFATERNDWADLWYNAQDFGENRHLGEDWNKTTGGDTDCGEPVYATADGTIVFAGDAGPGWGNVAMIDHTAIDGTTVQSLYGHMQTLVRTEGRVARRELIGTIGGANGRYPCHLHFEIRWNACPSLNRPGPGYADDKTGWIDPSEFIEKQRDPARHSQ
jgi:murein DD-endopeptidase MepM/ murein hydrolase activator NlpD